ncbi:MAG: hypothetical protein JNM76_15880 [Betaproteobacteria bacterium]|nr:hypothetical protein [Betaproteobacteria bacterium]
MNTYSSLTLGSHAFHRIATCISLAAAIWIAPARAETHRAENSLDRIVTQKMLPMLGDYFNLLASEKEAAKLDGVAVLRSRDKFLPGKIAIGMAHVLVETPSLDSSLPDRLRQYQEVARVTLAMDNETWGIYYYLSALNRLRKAGLLSRAVDAQTLDTLKRKLDWRHFVNPASHTLINLPANYYGVAFSVARLRVLMGWEDSSGADALLLKTLNHYREYSQYGFSDETEGQGRFDRYSILLIAELCQRFVEAELDVPPELLTLLGKAAKITLSLANTDGHGFSFGRSIGAYADTSALEILSISARLGVLNPEEKKYAYAYSVRIAERYLAFWHDTSMRSVDLWGKGRRTDAYRGKHRILGENLSLLHQYVATNQHWNAAGMRDARPATDLGAWIVRTQPLFTLNWFAKGEYDRALAVVRDGARTFSLLMVNGAAGQHANSPYYPLPYSEGLVAGVADSGPAYAQLTPKFTLADGSVLLPTVFIRGIKATRTPSGHQVNYTQTELNRVGDQAPRPDPRIRVETSYQFSKGTVTRTDRFTAADSLAIDSLTLDFLSFSEDAKQAGSSFTFKSGAATRFSVSGLEGCTARSSEGEADFQSPTGPMRTIISCSRGRFIFAKPLSVSWTLNYR